MDWDRVHCCSFKGRTLSSLEKSRDKEGEALGVTEGERTLGCQNGVLVGVGCGYVGGRRQTTRDAEALFYFGISGYWGLKLALGSCSRKMREWAGEWRLVAAANWVHAQGSVWIDRWGKVLAMGGLSWEGLKLAHQVMGDGGEH